MPSISIEKIQLKDSQKLLALARNSFYAAYQDTSSHERLMFYLDDNFTLEKIEAMIQNPQMTFFVAKLKEEFIGYVKLRWDRVPKDMLGAEAFEGKSIDLEKPIEIHRLYMMPDFYGKNIAALLLRTSSYFSLQNGFKQMWLSVWTENPRAIRFYEKHIFEKIGFFIFIFGTDEEQDFFMARPVKR